MKIGAMLVNYNNGSGSRVKDCSCSFQGNPLPQSEPNDFLSVSLSSFFNSIFTPCPLIVIDDASTDDSVEIIGKFQDKIARFVKKDTNEGLGVAINEGAEILIKDFECDIICRFDADIEFLTPGWDLRFIKCFENDRRIASVGACQLLPFGAIWALGDMLIHPEGYIHILGFNHQLKSAPYEKCNITFMSAELQLGNVECDSVMGCLAAFRSSAFTRVGGIRDDFLRLRGQTEDLNLRFLLDGYRIVALGGVRFIHRHIEHGRKNAPADSVELGKLSDKVWKKKWGWDKLSPDLNTIYEYWKDTPLARNLVKQAAGEVIYIGP